MKKTITGLATLAAMAALAACGGHSASKTSATTRPFQRGIINVNTQNTITYKVTSPGANVVTYTDPTDGSAQQIKGTMLWTKTWPKVPGGTNLAVIVQSSTGQGITCTILDDGKVLDSHTTTDSNITECSGAA